MHVVSNMEDASTLEGFRKASKLVPNLNTNRAWVQHDFSLRTTVRLPAWMLRAGRMTYKRVHCSISKENEKNAED
jgi:hypothetical protein